MTIFFTIREGLKGLAKARMPTTLSIVSIMLANVLAGVFLTLALNLNHLIGTIRDKIEMEVFISHSVTTEQVKDIEKKLKKIEGIESVKYISKDRAAERFKEEFGEDVMEVLQFNPFPPSYILMIKNEYRTFDKITGINNKVYQIDYIDEVVYQKTLLETVDRYVQIIFIIGVFLAIVVFVIGMALIYNTIRLSVYARKEAIQIMRLVGATSNFASAMRLFPIKR